MVFSIHFLTKYVCNKVERVSETLTYFFIWHKKVCQIFQKAEQWTDTKSEEDELKIN